MKAWKKGDVVKFGNMGFDSYVPHIKGDRRRIAQYGVVDAVMRSTNGHNGNLRGKRYAKVVSIPDGEIIRGSWWAESWDDWWPFSLLKPVEGFVGAIGRAASKGKAT